MPQNLSVLLISHYSGRYGANRSLADLARQLLSRGVKVTVVLPTRGEIEADFEAEGIPYEYIFHLCWIKSLSSRIGWVKSLVVSCVNLFADQRLTYLGQKVGANLIHINSSCTPVGYKASKWLGIPLVWHIREYLEEDYGISFLDKISALNHIGMANRVIVVSQDLALKYSSILGAKLGVIYNGVQDDSKSHHPILEHEELRLLMVGVLDKGKGHLDALRAVSLAKHEHGLKVRLRIVGSGNGSYPTTLLNMVKEFDIGDCVEFLGYLRDTVDVRKNADIGLVCSSREAFGRVTVEAMAAGMLVLGSRSGGTCEIIQHARTGLLYEAGNPQDLLDNLLWIHSHRELARSIAFRGKRYRASHFSMERVADEVLEVYGTLCPTREFQSAIGTPRFKSVFD